MIAVLLAALTGCGSADTATDFWSTEPQNDAQRFEVLRRVRAIDPCALIPRAELDAVGPVALIEPDTVGCGVQYNAAAPDAKAARVDLAILTGPTFEDAARNDGVVTQIGDVSLRVANNRERGLADSPGCAARLDFRSGMAVTLAADLPTTADPCAVTESLARTVLREWSREPARDPARNSVLGGADPCAVLPELEVTANPRDLNADTCSFTYRGGQFTVMFAYLGESTEGSPVPFGRRTAYYQLPGAPGVSTPTYRTVVGPAIATTGTPEFPRFPTVLVFGPDESTLHDVTGRVLALIPQA